MNIADTLVVFKSLVTVPVCRDLLKMMVIIGDNSSEHSFNNLAGNLLSINPRGGRQTGIPEYQVLRGLVEIK